MWFRMIAPAELDAGGRGRRRCHTGPVRIPAKVDYAIRALAELAAAGDGPVKAEQLAAAQDIPLTFLRDIMRELRRDRIVRSHRGPEGGFELGRPADEISLADIFRAVDGPLAEVRDQSLSAMSYTGAAAELPVVWMAVRAGLRRVLETTTVADLASGELPTTVTDLADEYRAATEARWLARGG
jgi:Rrf2 family protein